ncbi:MAG: heme ABC transporter ATP-binding protein [Actinobacteria bacterium]|nr:heme ABC transporter ATP-binding protein [Actinomycetota bacterium]
MTVLDAFRRTDLRLPERRAAGDVVLAVEGVSVSFGDAPVLADVTLEVGAGEVVALVGPNGAGKSTLLGVMAGDVVPGAGSVRIDGEPLDHWTFRELAVRRGVLLQQIDVAFPFSVTEVVRMGRAPWEGTAAEDWDDHVVGQAIGEVDLIRFADRIYRSLSGGERARAALARVLAQEPGILLLDEPTAALDIRHQELLFAIVGLRAARGDGVVVVLHDLNLAASYADRVVVLSRGRVAASGRPGAVMTAELLSEVYEHPIDVVDHPHSGGPMVVPRRTRTVS